MNTKHLYTLIITLCTMMLGVNGFATTMGDGEAPYVSWKHVNYYVGEDCIGLRWDRAYDDKTPQDSLKYNVSWISTDGNIGSYEGYNITSYIIKDLKADAMALINVSVVDEDGNRTKYDELIAQAKAGYLPIGIGGVQVTTSNMNDVLGDGGSVKVVKEDDRYLLEIHEDTIVNSSYGIWAACNLKIIPYGKCRVISTDFEGIWVAGNCEISGGGYIYFEGGKQGGAANSFGGDLLLRKAYCCFFTTQSKEYAVDINNNRLDIVCSNSEFIGGCGAITNIGIVQTLGCKSHPDWEYDKEQHKIVYTQISARPENIYVTTEPNSDKSIGIRIAGVEVTYANIFDVFGDEKGQYGRGSVYLYWDNPDLIKQPTIVLHDANFSGNESENDFDKIIDCYSTSLLEKVSIELYGENNISNGGINTLVDLHIKGPGALRVYANTPIKVIGDLYFEDRCSVYLNGNICAASLGNEGTFKVTNSSLTMNSAPDYELIWGGDVVKLEGSYIASNHSLQLKDGRAVFCNPDGSIAKGGSVVIKAGTKPEPTNKYDVNQDGSVNGADIVAIYNYIQAGITSGITSQRADVNSDNAVNGADAVAIYNYIVSGQK